MFAWAEAPPSPPPMGVRGFHVDTDRSELETQRQGDLARFQ